MKIFITSWIVNLSKTKFVIIKKTSWEFYALFCVCVCVCDITHWIFLNSLTSEYSQGWFLTILDVTFECPASKVGHLMSP